MIPVFTRVVRLLRILLDFRKWFGEVVKSARVSLGQKEYTNKDSLKQRSEAELFVPQSTEHEIHEIFPVPPAQNNITDMSVDEFKGRFRCCHDSLTEACLRSVFPLIFRIVAAALLIPATLSSAVLTVAPPLKVSGETRSAQHLCESSGSRHLHRSTKTDLVTSSTAQPLTLPPSVTNTSPPSRSSSCSSFSEKVPNFRSIFFKWVWAWFFIQLSLHLHILFTAAPPPSHQLNSSTGYSTSLPGSSGHSSFNETSRQARVGSLASVYRVHIAQSQRNLGKRGLFLPLLAMVLESFNCSCRPKAFERVPSRNWDKIFPQCSYQLHTPYLK
ncbi:hypothetical protein Bca4012_101392 [Brassica carinata]